MYAYAHPRPKATQVDFTRQAGAPETRGRHGGEEPLPDGSIVQRGLVVE